MKLADSEQLQPEDYWLLTDTWRMEWERGVQVPVYPDALPESSSQNLCKDWHILRAKNFRLPKKLLRVSCDQWFDNEIHQKSTVAHQADKTCRYDLDELDLQWLEIVNHERSTLGESLMEEDTFELVMEEIEMECYENINQAIRDTEGLGIEYDETVACDVCRALDCEEGNEMVFCDKCDICVHQACYGITTIPEGDWLCRTCVIGISPKCILCPNRGGAMKSTKSGTKWAHVACALWIPEVSIGCVERMEPITKISNIPASRWNLICSICRERTGACIQCSVKACKVAFHVSCGLREKLEMKTTLDENDPDDVKLKAYCTKHSKQRKSLEYGDSPRKGNSSSSPKKEMTSQEKDQARQKRIEDVQDEFYRFVNTHEVAEALKVDEDLVDLVVQYWKLKRKTGFNKPLLTPKHVEEDLFNKEREDSLYARMKMFIHLRQDLERTVPFNSTVLSLLAC